MKLVLIKGAPIYRLISANVMSHHPDLPRLERLYPHFCVVQVNNVFNMPQQLGGKRLVAYPHPQVVFQYFDGRTGELAYAHSIVLPRKEDAPSK